MKHHVIVTNNLGQRRIESFDGANTMRAMVTNFKKQGWKVAHLPAGTKV